MELNEYKCPNCGQPIHFNIYRQCFYCEYCGSSYYAESISEYNEFVNKHVAGEISDIEYLKNTWTEEEKENLKVLVCDSCGGELIVEKDTLSEKCPYCGSYLVNSKAYEEEEKPSKIIPFKHTKEEAIQILKKYYNSKFLLPNDFKSENQIKKIEGIYIPFWLYNANVNGDFVYKAKISYSHRVGDYIETKTKHYQLYREGKMKFRNLPVDCSDKIPDEYSQSIEPYDIDELIPFNVAYFAGYLADKSDFTVEESKDVANERMKSTLRNAFMKSTSEFDNVVESNSYIDIDHAKALYIMLPIWVLNTEYKGKKYTFMMNGQTGKIVSNMPIDNKKLLGSCFAIFALFFALVFALISLYMHFRFGV